MCKGGGVANPYAFIECILRPCPIGGKHVVCRHCPTLFTYHQLVASSIHSWFSFSKGELTDEMYLYTKSSEMGFHFTTNSKALSRG